jgi:hypothetical protein
MNSRKGTDTEDRRILAGRAMAAKGAAAGEGEGTEAGAADAVVVEAGEVKKVGAVEDMKMGHIRRLPLALRVVQRSTQKPTSHPSILPHQYPNPS